MIGNSVMIASLNPDEGATGLRQACGIGMRQTTEAAEQTFACTINQNDAITFSNFYICIYFKRNSAIWKSVVKIVQTTC